MTILDRYIARQFLINVVTLLVILFSFVVVIDVSLNIDRFAELANDLGTRDGEAPGTVRRLVVGTLIVADLWWPRLLQLFNYMLGLVMVGGMGFTCSQLGRHHEFLAMLAAGIPLRRIYRPILLAAALLLSVQALNRELVIPRIAPLLTRDHNDAGLRGLQDTMVPLTADGQGWILRAERFDPDAGRLEGVFLLERDEETRQARVRVVADAAVWRDGGWDLENGQREEIRTAETTRKAEPTPIERVELGLDPTTLKMNRYRSFRNSLSFTQTGQMLARADLLDDTTRAELQRLRWGRVGLMVSSMLTLVIALPFFVTREPKHMLAQSLKCAPITIGALALGVLGSSAGLPGIPAWLGVFVPAMILSTVAVGMIGRVES